MSAEAEPKPEQKWKDTSDEVKGKVETRKVFEDELEKQFVTGTQPKPTTVSEIDRLIDRGIEVGGLLRLDEEGESDKNFPGARIEGANAEWSGILERIRDYRAETIKDALRGPDIRGEFQVDDSHADAQTRPYEYVNNITSELVKAGYLKHETGRRAQPDGFFRGNRLVTTNNELDLDLKDLRKEATTLVKDKVESGLKERLDEVVGRGGSKGDELGRAIVEAMRQGMLEISEERRPGQAQSGGQRGPRRVEFGVRTPDDPRVRDLTEIYRSVFEEKKNELDAGQKNALDSYLRSAKGEFARAVRDGRIHRDDLMSGRDTAGETEARRRIDELNAADDLGHKLEDKANRTRVHNVDEAHNQALEIDREAGAGFEAAKGVQAEIDKLEAETQRMLASTKDRAEQAEIQRLHDERMGSEETTGSLLWRRAQVVKEGMEAQGERSKQAAREKFEASGFDTAAVDAAKRALDGAGKKEFSQNTITSSDKDGERRARIIRRELHLDSLPFLEERKGGMVDSYFRVPGNEHLVAFARHRRSNGEFLRFEVFSTAEAIQTRGESVLPPKEVRTLVRQTRETDLSSITDRGIGDSFFLEPGTGAAVMNQYRSYEKPPEPGKEAEWESQWDEKVDGWKKTNRRGGFFNWLSGGRL